MFAGIKDKFMIVKVRLDWIELNWNVGMGMGGAGGLVKLMVEALN